MAGSQQLDDATEISSAELKELTPKRASTAPASFPKSTADLQPMLEALRLKAMPSFNQAASFVREQVAREMTSTVELSTISANAPQCRSPAPLRRRRLDVRVRVTSRAPLGAVPKRVFQGCSGRPGNARGASYELPSQSNIIHDLRGSNRGAPRQIR